MGSAIRNFAGRAIWICDSEGPPIAGERDAIDLIGETYGTDVAWIALPAGRLSGDFLRLRTGMAGAFLQKLVNYQLRVAIVGDLSRQTSESRPLADFVAESNRGDHVWFVADEAELEARLAALP